RSAAPASSFVVVQQGKDFRTFKLLAPIEEVKLNNERQPRNFRAQGLGQLHAGVGCAAGGQQIVYDDDFLPGLHCVFVDLQGIDSVYQLITPLDGLRRKLARLANGNKARIQPIRQRRTEDEAAGFNGQDGIDLCVEIVLGESINQRGKADLVLEQGGDVVK